MTSTCICGTDMACQPFSENFDALTCPACGSRHFIPAAGHQAPEFSYDADNGKYAEQNYLHGKHLRWAHKQLLGHDWRGKKVLEIGCFTGFFLDELQLAGAQVWGFDVNENALSVGRERYGLQGRLHSSFEALKAAGPFDEILCIDVIEHLDSPDAFLAEVTPLLKNGGQIVVAGPTLERRFHDKSDYPPHHKWWFSRRGLDAFLRRNGYETRVTWVQRDGLLLLRNLLGKAIHGLSRREFYGDAVVSAPSNDGPIASRLYAAASAVGRWLCTALRISYCSTVLIAHRGKTGG
jgi:SAM-dependent methyltransferase